MQTMEPRIGDAFGEILVACQEAGRQPGNVMEIIEREDGYIASKDAARYFVPPQGDQAEWVLSRIRGRVLDVGAGAGRYTLALQDRGVEVVALDVSPLALEVCRQRGVRHTILGTVQQLAEKPDEPPVDCFLLMGNNLGLVGAPQDAPSFLEAITRLSSAGARILAEGNDASATTDATHVEYHDANQAVGRPRHLLRMRVRHQLLATQWFDYLMPTLDELNTLTKPNGWTISDSASHCGFQRE